MQTARTTRLVLSRRLGETILIGDDVRVTVARIDGNAVRLMVEAPESVKIFRKEILLCGPQ